MSKKQSARRAGSLEHPSAALRPPTASPCPVCLEEAFHWYAERDAGGSDGHCENCQYEGPFYYDPKLHEPTLKV